VITEMAETMRTEQQGFKVWRNPQAPSEPVRYMGEFYPSEGRPFLTGSDLLELGFERGQYTVLAPPGSPHLRLFSKWQTVVIPA
jgi:hypothetical protein